MQQRQMAEDQRIEAVKRRQAAEKAQAAEVSGLQTRIACVPSKRRDPGFVVVARLSRFSFCFSHRSHVLAGVGLPVAAAGRKATSARALYDMVHHLFFREDRWSSLLRGLAVDFDFPNRLTTIPPVTPFSCLTA